MYQRKLRGLDGRPAFRVTRKPRKQRLSDVTHKEALAEGFHGGKALRGFQATWVKENDKAWVRTQTLRHGGVSEADLLKRFRVRHAQRYCWVLHVALIAPTLCLPEQAHILSGRTQHGDGESDQYVRSGGIDPYAEAVDAATLIRLAVQGHERQQRPSRKERRADRHKRLFEGGSA